ncbi:hypothetical protein N4P55_04415 [Pseudomonas fluorescens]|uniref:dermonecrotic toxin domain-containing protein n=1 Tax=Pseudomonas TaxID=286 RepID=UPI0021D29190|nr:DUF6543 domain-containing protein [Pseudomonas fluorescens]UXV20603.1 hypothetical protein N4P55_04415 [Pseudomonas fluorescens]
MTVYLNRTPPQLQENLPVYAPPKTEAQTTQAPQRSAEKTVNPHETQLLKAYLEQVNRLALHTSPRLVSVPRQSTLGQWLELYDAHVRQPALNGWLFRQGIHDIGQFSVAPSTGTLSAEVEGKKKTFSLTDTSGWGQISAALLATASVIAPGKSGDLRVEQHDGFLQVHPKVVAHFQGVPFPQSAAFARAQFNQLAPKDAFDPIPPDDQLRPASRRSEDAMQAQIQSAGKFYSTAPAALDYKLLAVDVANNLPDTRAEAKKWAEALILKLTGNVVDADTIYLNRFRSASSANTVTGWEHTFEEPYSSLRLPDALLKNFSEHDWIPGTLDQETGLYTVGAGQSTQGGYGAHNQFALAPSAVMHESWKTDFQTGMTQKIDHFWRAHTSGYETAIKGEFVYQARKQLKAAEARSPAERKLQPPEQQFTRDDYRLVMGAVSNLSLDENAPLSVEQLMAMAPVKGIVQANALSIHGFTSNDIVRFSAADGRQVVSIPGNVPAYLRFDSLAKLEKWVIDQSKHPKKREALLSHFPLIYRQDHEASFGTRAASGVVPFLWLTHIADKKEGLNTLFDKMATGALKDTVINDSHSNIEGDVFAALAFATKERMQSDADVVIKSNSEVIRDTWLNDITVAAGLLAKLAPIAAPVAAAAVLAGLTELALGAEKASSGDTQAERKDGASKAFDGLLNTLFSVGASAVPEDPFALPPETKLPPAEPLIPPTANEIQEPRPGPSSGNSSVVNAPVPQPLPRSESLIRVAQHAVPDGEALIKNATRDALGVYRMTDSKGTFRQFVRFTDETETSRIFEISGRYRSGDAFARIINPDNGAGLMVITPGRDAQWERAPADGGLRLWPWTGTPSPTPSENLTPKFSDLFADFDEPAVKQSERFDALLKVDEAKPFLPSTKGYEENGELKRKLVLTWSAPKQEFTLLESEKAIATPYSDSNYSHNFILDLNRSDYSVTKLTEHGELHFSLDAHGDSAETIRLNRLKQFESAIPDAAMRSRISEVAHQGSVEPATIELISTLKDGYSPKVSTATYSVEYDPVKNEARVKVAAQWDVNDLSGDEMKPVSDMKMTSSRTFLVSLGNEVSDNPYIIQEMAPTQLEATLPGGPAQ